MSKAKWKWVKSKLKQQKNKFKQFEGMKTKHFQSSWDELPLWQLGMLCSSKLLG